MEYKFKTPLLRCECCILVLIQGGDFTVFLAVVQVDFSAENKKRPSDDDRFYKGYGITLPVL